MKVKSKSKKINKAWLLDHLNDTYVKLAKKEGFRARAAYKLKEIDETLGLFKPGQVVVDLGAAPGAWSQYVRRRLSSKVSDVVGAALGPLNGTIIALDILAVPHGNTRQLHSRRRWCVREFKLWTLRFTFIERVERIAARRRCGSIEGVKRICH